MAHVRDLRKRERGYTGEKPYEARHRDPFGKEKCRSFRTLREARNWLAEQEVAKGRGDWVDPLAGKVTFETFAEQWRETQIHRPSTAAQVETYFRTRVYPALGARALASIRPSQVQALVRAMSDELAPATVVSVYGHVSAVFRAAARDRIITRTPCEGITLPKSEKDHKVVPLTVDQVTTAVAEMPDRLSAAAWVAAGTGLRQGEVLGLTLDRVDFLRRTVKVDRQMVSPAKGDPDFGPPKTRASYRTVPLPESVAVVLSEHLRQFPAREGDGLIFTNERGGPVRRTAIARQWKAAATRAKLPEGATFHALRHFYASALIQYGESVKVVQARLGHASAMETLDTYGHLWPDSEDSTRQAIDAVLGNPAGLARGAATG